MSPQPHTDATSAKLQEGQDRLAVLGAIALAYNRRVFLPIIHQEQLRNISAAIAQTLLSHYPILLLSDPDPLLGALEMAMDVGMLAGCRHAAAIPPELAALVQPGGEER